MKILVTGSNGQLGSELKDLAKNSIHTFDFHDVDTLDLLNNSLLASHFNKHKPDVVINCAAYTAVDKAETDEQNAIKGNAEIVKNLANQCILLNSRFIHISTDYVFDGTNYKPYSEEDSVKPTGIYGKTKLAGETEALKHSNSIVIRTSWLYSSHGNNFVKTMIKLGKEREELNVIFDQIGTPTYARDLAKTILTIVELTHKNRENFVPGIYHFSNEGVSSWFDFAKEIMDICDIKCDVKPIETFQYPTPAKRPHYSVLNKAKVKKTFGIEIPYWKDSLKICIQQIMK